MKTLTRIVAFVAALFIIQTVSAQTINTQGVLRDANGYALDDGTYNVTFRIYDAETGGTIKWSDTYSVDVTNGVFSVTLGDDSNPINMLSDDQPYWVSIEVGSDGEMEPRLKLTTTPYEMNYLTGNQNTFPGTGPVGIGTLNPTNKLEVEGNIEIPFGSGFQAGNGTNRWVFRSGWEAGRNDYLDLYVPGDGSHQTTPALSMIDNLNVGIGTDWPKTTLHVRNGSDASTSNGSGYLLLGDQSGPNLVLDNNEIMARNNGEVAPFYLQNDGGNTIVNKYGGNVGIGIEPPQAKLHIGNAGESDDIPLLSMSEDENNEFVFTGDFAGSGGSGNALKLDTYWGNTAMTWTGDGKVGIGTTDPQVALHVTGPTNSQTNMGANWIHGLHRDGEGSRDKNSAANIVAYFDGNLVANGGVLAARNPTWSDARAKHIKGQSNSDQDLQILRKIKITDYQFIDQKMHGRNTEKKAIAQQVEKVYPQAVSLMKKAIPNVYEFAKDYAYDRKRHELTISTETPHNFKKGNKVNIFTDQADLTNLPVKKVISKNTFVVSGDHQPQKVFVYGKWVDDYHVVDYDAIAMLNVSATQELASQVDSLQGEVSVLQKENTTLKAELGALKSQMAEFATTIQRIKELEAQEKAFTQAGNN